MGKKAKKKARSGHTDKRGGLGNPKKAPQDDQSVTPEQSTGVASVSKERKLGCVHLDKSMDLIKVTSKLELAEGFRCEDCRESAVDRKSKGKGKHGKNKGADSKAIWVCLECGHFACGGIGFPDANQRHASRHAKQERHSLAIQVQNPQLRWCFPCSSPITVDKFENDEQKDLLSGVVKLLKKRPSVVSSVDVEDVWFGRGSILNETKSESSLSTDIRGWDFYTVRGLMNLGNTCFFNSVMQNLLAMDRFQDDLLKLGDSTGPLTSSFKKLYAEINAESGVRNVLNPKSLFGCVCSKAPQFRGYQQQDSHELLRYLLDGLSTEDLRVKKSTNFCAEHDKSSHVTASFVDAIFGGQLSSTVSCIECGHSSVVYEPFLDLSVPVPTKRPPPKKVQTVSRNRKTKPPPRKAGKTRLKHGGDGISAPVLVDPKPPPSDSSHGSLPTAVTVEYKVGYVNGTSSVCPSDCGDVVHGNGSLSQSDGIIAAEVSNDTNFSNAAQQAASLYEFTWMDYTESMSLADEECSALVSEEAPAIENSGSTDVLQNDVTHQDVSDEVLLHQGKDSPNAAPEEMSIDDSGWMDYLGPTLPVDQEVWDLQPEETPANQDSGRIDTLDDGIYQDTDTLSNVVLSPHEELTVMSDSLINSFEDEVPLQVGDSEVLLLPYKEEPTVLDNEPSSSAVGDGEDMMGFGLGDMFNEPEVTMGPHPNPSAGYGEGIENGFLAGNSSESNPDEVDDTDSPVSIESCLSHFTKPEILADEHAWHCENCTKVILEIRKKSRKRRLKPLTATQNGCADNLSSFGAGETNQNNGSEDSNREVHVADAEQIRDMVEAGNHQSTNGFSGASETCAIFPTAEKAATSDNSASNSSEESAKIAPDEATGKASELVKGGDSEDSDDEEVDSKRVKAMRDATKRILISKLPPILTIHLKRFNQDARGRLSKLNGHVVFKEFVDLKPYMHSRCPEKQGEYKYRLVGLVEHLGSMRGGHYVAYVRGGDRRKGEEAGSRKSVWYYASDAHVRETTLEEVLRCEAYILFYEKL